MTLQGVIEFVTRGGSEEEGRVVVNVGGILAMYRRKRGGNNCQSKITSVAIGGSLIKRRHVRDQRISISDQEELFMFTYTSCAEIILKQPGMRRKKARMRGGECEIAFCVQNTEAQSPPPGRTAIHITGRSLLRLH
jgi:hypothetical protein